MITRRGHAFLPSKFRMETQQRSSLCMCRCVCWGLRDVRVAQPKHVVTRCVSPFFSLMLFFTITFSVLHRVLHANTLSSVSERGSLGVLR